MSEGEAIFWVVFFGVMGVLVLIAGALRASAGDEQ